MSTHLTVPGGALPGLLVPDIPLEETYAIGEIAKKYNVDLVLLTTPTTEHERMIEIAKNTEGFLYLVGGEQIRKILSKNAEKRKFWNNVVFWNHDK